MNLNGFDHERITVTEEVVSYVDREQVVVNLPDGIHVVDENLHPGMVRLWSDNPTYEDITFCLDVDGNGSARLYNAKHISKETCQKQAPLKIGKQYKLKQIVLEEV